MHLIIDGYGSDSRIMQDEEFLYRFLDSYPPQIGMTKISSPFVFRYVGSKPEDWGISGFIFIAESHISVHTFVERCYINIDVFSCKNFDAKQVVSDLRDKFRLVKLRSYLVNRDLEAPEPTAATRVAKFELL